MSGFVKLERRCHQVPDSPSLDSDVLSGSAILSSASPIDAYPNGWVLFSPQVSVRHEDEVEREDHLEPLESIDPLNLENSRSSSPQIVEDSFISTRSSRTLELPTHNGVGSFSQLSANSSRLELFDRINSWRIEQSQLQPSAESSSPVPPQESAWHWLKEKASHGLHNIFDLDEQAIDALFSRDFSYKARGGPSSSSSDRPDKDAPGYSVNKPHHSGQYHLQRAQEYGPAGWEDKMLRHTLRKREPADNSGFFLALVSKLLTWTQASHDETPRRSRYSTRYEAYRGVANANAGHSYHFAEIQGSIASVTSTFAGVAWSDPWDSTTSSIGLAAA